MSRCSEQDAEGSAARAARAAERRNRIVAHRAKDFEDAARWDLEFWQSLTPQERLSAYFHLRKDVELAQAARATHDRQARSSRHDPTRR